MTISDFAQKHSRTAKTDGLITAGKQATSEALMRALLPIARRKATPIWAEEWDICLILDACRHDLFTEAARQREWLPNQPESRWSVGSASPEWINETFRPNYNDMISRTSYVTANPFSGKDGTNAALDQQVFPLSDRPFAYLDEPWRDMWGQADLPTITPQTMTDRGMAAYQHRDKLDADRLVVHYMQPHIPFRSRPEWCKGWDLEGFGTGGGKGEKDDWHRVRDGEIDANRFWAAYRDNLEWALDAVNQYRHQTDATILITSDHGNAMGEFSQWSHPHKSANPVLRKVPWVIINGVGDQAATDFSLPNSERASDANIENRLKALGYQ